MIGLLFLLIGYALFVEGFLLWLVLVKIGLVLLLGINNEELEFIKQIFV